jgi:phosphate-selective porin OprO and OprP
VVRRIVPTFLMLFVTLVMAATALAQQPTAREQELLKRIDALEKRLQDVEKKLGEKPAPEAKPEKKPGEDLRTYWKEGLHFDSANGGVKLQTGVIIQDDWAAIDQEGPTTTTSGARGGHEFRRARLSVSGTVRDNIEFKAEYDFAGGVAGFKDVWLGMKSVPYVGTVRLGHFKEPFSLDELTSDPFVTFMERGLPNAFAPSRNVGIMLTNSCLDDRLTWAAGAFQNADDFGNGLGQNWDFTGRVTGLPCAKANDRFIHAGLGLSFRNPPDGAVRYSARPEAHLAPKLVDTGTIAADSVTLIGPELAIEHGPFSLQGEYTVAKVNTSAGPDVDFQSYYVLGSYFITGENRPYRRTTGVFDRVIPKRSFLDGHGGPGAWEVAMRYSNIDLNDGPVTGGKLNDWTFGVNWYLNPVTRFTLNYVMADGNPAPDERIWEMRTQLAF